MKTETFLLEKYGPLITLSKLETLLDRKTEGIRLTIREGDPAGLQLGAARIKIGRRVYFKTDAIAKLLDGNQSTPHQELIKKESTMSSG